MRFLVFFFFFLKWRMCSSQCYLPVWTTVTLATYAELSTVMKALGTARFEWGRYRRWWEESQAENLRLKSQLRTVRHSPAC